MHTYRKKFQFQIECTSIDKWIVRKILAALTELACLTQRSMSDCRANVMRFWFWTSTNDTWMPEKCLLAYPKRRRSCKLDEAEEVKWNDNACMRVKNTQSVQIYPVFILPERSTRFRLLDELSSSRDVGEMNRKYFTWLSLCVVFARVCYVSDASYRQFISPHPHSISLFCFDSIFKLLHWCVHII